MITEARDGSNKTLLTLLPAVKRGMQIQNFESKFLCVIGGEDFFFPFRTKLRALLNNQLCRVQTTKIPVLHYQILHIENIYKAQV